MRATAWLDGSGISALFGARAVCALYWSDDRSISYDVYGAEAEGRSPARLLGTFEPGRLLLKPRASPGPGEGARR